MVSDYAKLRPNGDGTRGVNSTRSSLDTRARNKSTIPNTLRVLRPDSRGVNSTQDLHGLNITTHGNNPIVVRCNAYGVCGTFGNVLK